MVRVYFLEGGLYITVVVDQARGAYMLPEDVRAAGLTGMDWPYVDATCGPVKFLADCRRAGVDWRWLRGKIVTTRCDC